MALSFRDIEELLLKKPKGVYEIQSTPDGRAVISIYKFGEPEQQVFCVSLGHANQVRQELTDRGMVGLVGDAQ